MYLGRFAPSPTGPLHFGSLIAAVGSYLDARHQQGKWLLRMDDLDPPREITGAAQHIIQTLEAFGFEWDGDIVFQSTRQAAYQEALRCLNGQGLTYPCICSRKQLIADGHVGASGIRYPGTCRNARINPLEQAHTLRLRCNNDPIEFEDRLQGIYTQALASDIGDFQLQRRDGVYAYHLAVVIDDAAQGITDIVRGYDLLDSTPRQIYLQRLLQLPTPRYAHLPIAINQEQQKLSKQTYAQPLDVKQASTQLWHALNFLDQAPPKTLNGEPLTDIWSWALRSWTLEKIRSNAEKFYPDTCTD